MKGSAVTGLGDRRNAGSTSQVSMRRFGDEKVVGTKWMQHRIYSHAVSESMSRGPDSSATGLLAGRAMGEML
jgi:hypothetical protein